MHFCAIWSSGSGCPLYSHHGIDKELTGKYYWSNTIGYNYRWTNIQAALALAQLRRIDELLNYKKWLYESYFSNLKDINGLYLNKFEDNVEPSHWITAAILTGKNKIKKEIICDYFKDKNIDMRPAFYPISSMPPFKKYLTKHQISKKNINTYYLSKYGIMLPSGYNLKKRDILRICNTLKKIIDK